MFFGYGLSRRLEDLGGQGEPPTHPKLLDHLASEFRNNGWDMKKLIRTLVTSDAYKQSSVPTEKLAKADPLNRLYARQSRFRVDAEFVRDTALSISGLIGKIIEKQMADNQFLNSDITFREIKVIKKVIKKKLMNIYHLRLEYPE